MSKLVDSTSRGPLDYFHFAVAFFGLILTVAGVITTSPGFAIFGVLVLAFGLAYFLMQN